MLEVASESGSFEASLTNHAAFREALRGLHCGVSLSRAVAEELKTTGTLPTIERDQRRFVRHRCGVRGILFLRQTLPSISRQECKCLVLVKNISRSGVCLLHDAQLLPGERFRLWMEVAPVREVEIARCRRLQSKCYEIGAEFV